MTSKTNRLRRPNVCRSLAFVARRLPDSRRNVKDMLIFNFQGSEVVCLMEELFYPSTPLFHTFFDFGRKFFEIFLKYHIS